MQYLILGFDGTDEKALERRMAAREAHLKLGDQMRDKGTMLFAVAMLDEKERMVGSALVCDFETRADLDAYLDREPYVTGKVWQKIEVRNCKVGPSFAPKAGS